MPIIKSAKKRVRVAKKAAIRNSKTKRSLRTAIKAFQTKSSSKTLSSAQSAVDQAVKKGLMHPNKANRKKRQLAAQAKSSGVKSTASAKKTTVAKPAPKTAPAKKPAAKKPATKKTTKKS